METLCSGEWVHGTGFNNRSNKSFAKQAVLSELERRCEKICAVPSPYYHQLCKTYQYMDLTNARSYQGILNATF